MATHQWTTTHKLLKTLIEKELENVRELRVESLETSTNCTLDMYTNGMGG